MTRSMSCSTRRIDRPFARARRRISCFGGARVAMAHALRGLVEQQHDAACAMPAIRRSPAAAARRATGCPASSSALSWPVQTALEQFLHPLRSRARFAERGRQQRPGLARGPVRGQAQVLAHRQLEEQVGDLERARQAGEQQAILWGGIARSPRRRRSAPCPRCGSIAPLIRLNRVLLPAPLGPITAVMWPRLGLEATRRCTAAQRAEADRQVGDHRPMERRAHRVALPCLDRRRASSHLLQGGSTVADQAACGIRITDEHEQRADDDQ
jgi:hypothetical protein